MRIILFIVLLNLTCVHFSIGQSNIRINNYWDNNLYYINSASINEQYQKVVSLAARNQGVGYNGAPSTYFATGTFYSDDMHTQFGVKAVQDVVGYTLASEITFSYAYSIPLTRDCQLNLGMGLSSQRVSYDASKINLASTGDTFLYEQIKTVSRFNADLGLEINTSEWKLGLSSQRVASRFIPENNRFPNTNFLYWVYRRRDYGTAMDFGYGLSGIQYNKIYQGEANLMAYFKAEDQRDIFGVGLFYRTWNEVGALLGFDLSRSLYFSYCYNFSVGGILNSNSGAHELIMTYHFEKLRNCKHCKF